MDFSFDPETRRKLGYQLIDRINQYFSSLPERAVQLPADKRTFGELTDRMPELGESAGAVLDDICRELVDKGFHVPSANYFGLMNPTPTYISVLAEALVAALNPQLASLARSQLASKIESETVRWIGERIYGLGEVPHHGLRADRDQRLKFDGTFTTGGNEANFSALAMAVARHFPESIEEGVAAIGAAPVLYASSEAHHSIDKTVGLLGLGRKALRRVPVNERMQMEVAMLEAAIARDRAAGHRPFCVVATAGTTNSGAIDDIESLADICKHYDLWLHVDGAYGAAAAFSDKHRGLVRGIERACSVTIDPHKWLAMPFAAGVVLTRHPEALQQTFAVTTPYMPKAAAGASPLVDNFKVSAQWSRRMNSLKFYLTLRVHGRKAYEELIDRQLALAAEFADWMRKSQVFELAAPQVLPIVNFRLKRVAEKELEAAHLRLVEEVTRDGRQWISTTFANGRSVLRMMVISYLTGEDNVRQLQDALLAAAEKQNLDPKRRPKRQAAC